MGLVGWGRGPTPATPGPARRRRSSDPLCDCPPFAVTVDRRGLPSWTMLTTTMLTTLLTSRTRKGVESTQSDERGRTAMTADAERWVRFANLGMLPAPSQARERCVLRETRRVADCCADPRKGREALNRLSRPLST